MGKEKLNAMTKTKRCIDCGEIKDIAEFQAKGKSKKGKVYRSPNCRTCRTLKHNKYMRERFAVRSVRKDPSLITEKQCARCKNVKDSSEFYWMHTKRKDGLATPDTICKSCRADVRNQWKEKNPGYYSRYDAAYRRNTRLVREYGITQQEYLDLVALQDGKCLICKQEPSDSMLYVDHNHISGTVRGLLCMNCNTAIGNLKDSPFVAAQALCYLLEYGGDTTAKTHVTETNTPGQAESFLKVIMQMYVVHCSKNADYSPANILGTGEVGLATRLWDKTARFMNLMGFKIDVSEPAQYSSPKEPKHESIDDTLIDLAVYAIIGLLLRAGKWGN